MTVSVRPWPEIAADLRMGHAHGIGGRLDNEAAVAGDALAAVVAAVHTALDQMDKAMQGTGSQVDLAHICVSEIKAAVGR